MVHSDEFMPRQNSADAAGMESEIAAGNSKRQILAGAEARRVLTDIAQNPLRVNSLRRDVVVIGEVRAASFALRVFHGVLIGEASAEFEPRATYPHAITDRNIPRTSLSPRFTSPQPATRIASVTAIAACSTHRACESGGMRRKPRAKSNSARPIIHSSAASAGSPRSAAKWK